MNSQNKIALIIESTQGIGCAIAHKLFTGKVFAIDSGFILKGVNK